MVVAHLHLCDAATFYLLDADIVECHVAHKVAVAAVDGQAALVVHLWFSLSENVDILIHQVFDGVAHLRVAVNADEDGMCHVGPQRGVLHVDVSAISAESLARGVGRGAVVRIAAEHTVVENVGGCKNIQAIAPTGMRDATHIVQPHTVRTACWAGVHNEAINQYILRAIDMSAFIATCRTGHAAPEDAYVLSIIDGKGAGKVAAASEIDGCV